jgi:hypothetical protein
MQPPPVYETYVTPLNELDRFAALGLMITFAIVLAYEPLMWVDQHTFPLLGYVVYPVEWTVNKILFPEAMTPFRGNIGALLVASIYVVILGLVVGVLAVVLGVFGWMFRGATILHSCVSADADFMRVFYRARIATPRNHASR